MRCVLQGYTNYYTGRIRLAFIQLKFWFFQRCKIRQHQKSKCVDEQYIVAVFRGCKNILVQTNAKSIV